jgi:hypothetical protein
MLHLPFEGNPVLLELRPSTYTLNPPRAGTQGQEIILRYEWTDNQPPDREAAADELASTLERWMRAPRSKLMPATPNLRPGRANRSSGGASGCSRIAPIWTTLPSRFGAGATRRRPTRRQR